MMGAWLNSVAGIDLLHVPYKGDAATLPDLLSGRIQVGFVSPLGALPNIKSGKLRPLAYLGPKRAPFAPEIRRTWTT